MSIPTWTEHIDALECNICEKKELARQRHDGVFVGNYYHITARQADGWYISDRYRSAICPTCAEDIRSATEEPTHGEILRSQQSAINDLAERTERLEDPARSTRIEDLATENIAGRLSRLERQVFPDDPAVVGDEVDLVGEYKRKFVALLAMRRHNLLGDGDVAQHTEARMADGRLEIWNKLTPEQRTDLKEWIEETKKKFEAP